jgi:multiple sugar transport system substrate-binding protein
MPSAGCRLGPAGANPATELDSAQAQKALQFMQGLIGQGISPATVDTFEETDTDSVFDTGHAAFMRGWDSAYANATSGPNALRPDQVGVEAPPTFQGQSGVGWSTLGGWGLFINPRTRNLPAALTFVKWMAGWQAQWILATQYSEIPANASVRNDPAGIRRDQDAVTAGLPLPCHSGAMEGNASKIKMIKRQMYGRASFALLR